MIILKVKVLQKFCNEMNDFIEYKMKKAFIPGICKRKTTQVQETVTCKKSLKQYNNCKKISRVQKKLYKHYFYSECPYSFFYFNKLSKLTTNTNIKTSFHCDKRKKKYLTLLGHHARGFLYSRNQNH